MKAVARVRDVPSLSPDDLSDAAFRARDRAWAAVADLFDQLQEEECLTYEELGVRIGKKKSQVHKWLSSPCNVTLQSFGLLAEGMNADLRIELSKRVIGRSNAFHDCESAALRNKFESFKIQYEQRQPSRHIKSIQSSTFDIMVDAVD